MGVVLIVLLLLQEKESIIYSVFYQIPYFDRIHPLTYKRSLIDARSTNKPKPSSKRNIINRLQEYQECIHSEHLCSTLEYSESYASIQLLTMPPFNLERGLLEKFMYSHIFDSLSYHNKLELLNLIMGHGHSTQRI